MSNLLRNPSQIKELKNPWRNNSIKPVKNLERILKKFLKIFMKVFQVAHKVFSVENF